MAVLITQGNSRRKVALRQTRNLQTAADREQMDQIYPTFTQKNGDAYRTFEFPFPPSNVAYQNLTPEWIEINRPGYAPLVGLSKYNLMRVQFEFLIAAPFDGIKYSVEEELILLRNMANSTEPVFFNGMDSIISTPIDIPGTSRSVGGGMFFRITDFSITSMRRNPKNEITAAQCSVSLQEDFSLDINAVTMPAIEYPLIMKPRVKKDKPADTGTTRCKSSTQIEYDCNINDILASVGL